MLKRRVVLLILLSLASLAATARSKRPRYIFVLPNGYVGWIQIIFNDPAASALPKREGGYVIDVPESGLTRTSDLRVHDFKRLDEFHYRPSPGDGTQNLGTVPTQDFLPGDSHGGFGVMDTGGKGKGYSWFVFIGPPPVRAKTPLADWDKEVATWRSLHGNARVSAPDPYPSPGRIQKPVPPN